MAAIIKVIGVAHGLEFPVDLWVEHYDIDAEPDPSCASQITPTGCVINGVYGGRIVLTNDVTHAHHYHTSSMALATWNAVSMRRPRRPDGRPNKPMTALTVEVQPI